MRELSDDEIIAVRKATPSDYSRPWGDTLAFARAILAAAQAAMPPREPCPTCGQPIPTQESLEAWAQRMGNVLAATPSDNAPAPSADERMRPTGRIRSDMIGVLQEEVERLTAIVRAADTMHLKPTMDNINAWLEARAKWGGE